MTSPATGTAIPQTALNAVGQIISGGAGAQAAATNVTNALLGAGGNPAATTTLMNALAALATATPGTSVALYTAAAQAFDAFVTSAPDSFFTGAALPAQFLAIHAGLVSIGTAMK
jgi:hypothetical protein